MERDEDVERLLTEIRDLQRETLDEYKKVTARSLEMQQRAVERQEQLGRLYTRVVIVGGAIVLLIVALVVYLFGKLRLPS